MSPKIVKCRGVPGCMYKFWRPRAPDRGPIKVVPADPRGSPCRLSVGRQARLHARRVRSAGGPGLRAMAHLSDARQATVPTFPAMIIRAEEAPALPAHPRERAVLDGPSA